MSLLFFVKPDLREYFFFNIETMGDVRHGHYHCPWPSCARSGAMRLFPASWATQGALGLLWFKQGGALPIFYLENFKIFFAATSWAAATTSTSAGSPPAPIPGQRACFPHIG
jgi:hypothetical protein